MGCSAMPAQNAWLPKLKQHKFNEGGCTVDFTLQCAELPAKAVFMADDTVQCDSGIYWQQTCDDHAGLQVDG